MTLFSQENFISVEHTLSRGTHSVVDQLIHHNPTKRISRTLLSLALFLQSGACTTAPFILDAVAPVAGISAAARILSGDLISGVSLDTIQPIGITSAINPAISSSSPPNEKTISLAYPPLIFGGSTVTFDSNFLPQELTDAKGRKIKLDTNEMKKLKQEAVDSHLPRLAFAASGIFNDLDKRTPEQKLEHPVLKNLPEGVLSDSELAERGISIIQGSDTKLYITKEAFSPDGPLKYYNGENGRKLQIILVNGPVIADRYMNSGEYVKFWSSDLQLHSEDALKYAEEYEAKELWQLDLDLNELVNSPSSREVDSKIITTLAHIEMLKKMSAVELADNFSFSNDPKDKLLRGKYFPQGVYYPTSRIFVAVGTSNQDSSQQVVYGFDSEGGFFAVRNVSDLKNDSMLPKPNQSAPDPADYPADPEKKPGIFNYKWGAIFAGFVLRHEDWHDLMQNLIGSDKNVIEFSEYQTDENTMLDYEVAWKRWVNSGFKDYSGFPFLFSVPGENNTKDYILSKNFSDRHNLIDDLHLTA